MLELGTLLEALPEVQVSGLLTQQIGRLRFDSRQVEAGDVFVAMSRPGVDSHQFIDAAVEAGACAVVLERNQWVPDGCTKILVRDSAQAMALLAARFYGNPARHVDLIGITGTNGKTTVSYMCRALLTAAGINSGLFGTVEYDLGNQVLAAANTTPETEPLHGYLAALVEAGLKVAVMEVSSHALATKRVYDLDFRVGVFTNLSRDHMDFHGSEEEYIAAKMQLFKQLAPGVGRAVINIDDVIAKALIEASVAPVICYGLTDAAQLKVVDISMHAKGIDCRLVYDKKTIPLALHLRGRFNLYNALAAAGAGLAYGLDLDTVCAGLETVRSVPGRFETIDEGQPFSVFVDYAHTPDALKNVLQAARPLTDKRIIVLFGCGGDRDRGKRPQMAAVCARLADMSFITSDNPRTEDPKAIIADIIKGLTSTASYVVETDRRQAIYAALATAGTDDVVVIAGKGHETYQEIDGQRFHFDDRDVARQVLIELGYG